MSLHVDPRARLRNIVSKAIAGCVYEDSHREGEGMLVIDARRADGTSVHLRFRGVKDSESTIMPEPGASMKFAGVGSAEKFSVLRVFFPTGMRMPFESIARVRIDAGGARIEVVCQDVDWWEDAPSAGPEAGTDRP